MVVGGRPKLIDFGFIRNMHSVEPLTTQVVSLHYRAPELLISYDRYDEKVDLWSMGCVLYLAAQHRLPFKGTNEMETLNSITTQVPDIPFRLCNMAFSKFKFRITDVSHTSIPFLKSPLLLQRLILQMLKADPRDRISAANALKHPYFQG